MTLSGTPFSVFTPYKNAWLKKLSPFYLKAYPVSDHLKSLAPARASRQPLGLADIGFENTNLGRLGIAGGAAAARRLLADFTPRMARYREARDFPARKGPSYLSVHLRFGTISVRELARARGWIAELETAGIEVPVDVCTYHSPRVRGLKGRVMTNAAKWAYYAPGMLGVEVAFGSLRECVESAVRGEVWRDPALWSTP